MISRDEAGHGVGDLEDDKTVVDCGLAPEANPASAHHLAESFSFHGTLGEGGLGRVLDGYDESIGRKVAIKELKIPPGGIDRRWVPRFLREATLTGRLEHPGIVPIYHVGRKPDGMPYYVMRLLRGKTLSQVLKECQGKTPADGLRLRLAQLSRLIDIAQAMAYAHARGVIHRDLKPPNVVIGPFGETVILDWGLAKVMGDADLTGVRTTPCEAAPAAAAPALDAELTSTGEVLGTPSYMAPEQVSARFGPITQRTDVFALGCILYYILVGHPPLTGDVTAILETLIRDDPMPSPRKAAVPVPNELASICERALNKDPLKRHANAGEFADELKAFADGRLVATHAYSSAELLRRFVARNRIAVVAGLLSLIAVIGAAVVSVSFGIEAMRRQAEAIAAEARAEAAMEKVTKCDDRAIKLADDAAKDMGQHFAVLRADMAEVAQKLAATDLKTENQLQPIVAGLQDSYKNFVSFVVIGRSLRGPTTWPESSPAKGLAWKFVPDDFRIGQLVRMTDGSWTVQVQVPILRGQAVVGLLGGTLALKSIPESMLSGTDLGPYRLWILQSDGRFVYSWRTGHIGDDLFQASVFDDFPDIREFGTKVLQRNNGVGVYRYLDFQNLGPAEKIAAWEVVAHPDDLGWKVVMVTDFHGGC